VQSSAPLLTMTCVHKRFGGVRALRGADLEVSKPGVVHALLGQNGCGKSTLLGVLSGQLRPDEGTIELNGRLVTFHSPVSAIAHGVAMVSQETAVAPDLTVAENVLLGRLGGHRAAVNWKKTRRQAQEVLEQIGADYALDCPVRALRPDQRQMVEIARALSARAKVLVLDEPTSSLSDDEVEGLFAAIRRLTASGVSIIFVSHRLDEVFTIADEITVLRDGLTVARGEAARFGPSGAVEAMVGEVDLTVTRQAFDEDVTEAAVLRVTNVTVAGCLRDVSLDVSEGEVVGLAGLVGSGRSELLEAIFGVRATETGIVSVAGAELDKRTPRTSIRHGVGFLPPDRKSQGLVLGMSVRDNLSMIATCMQGRWKPPRRREEEDLCTNVAAVVNIVAPLESTVGNLSGGNQQKVALAKRLVRGPKVLLLDEPTRGVDVAAKADIHQHLRDAAAKGMGLLVSSSENDELLALCDRILVLYRGRVVATLTGDEATEARLASLTGGHL
jgi:ABC-type sugar transport system ATPase subunit